MAKRSPIQTSVLFLFYFVSLFSGSLLAQEFNFVADQTSGSGTAIVEVDVVDPAVTTGNRYQVIFDEQNGDLFYSIDNLDTQLRAVENQPLAIPSPLFDGLIVSVMPAVSQIRDIEEVMYDSMVVDPPVPVFRPGDREAEGGNNSTGDYTFIGGGGVGDFAQINRSEANADFADFEIRFDGDPLGRNKLIYAFQGGQGTINVPFSIWNIGIGTPDDDSDDRQIIAVGFDDSGNPAAFDGGASPSDGGPGYMYDRIYIYDLEQANLPQGDIDGNGMVNYDDVLQDIEDNGGDISFLFFGRPYINSGFESEVLSRFAMVSLNGDPEFLPPAGTTVRITTSKALTEDDVFEFTSPQFGLFTRPVALNFGNVGLNMQRVMPLTVLNNSQSSITVSEIITSPPVFQASRTNFTMAAGDSEVVDVSFTPSSEEQVEGILNISSDDGFFPEYKVDMMGEGLPQTTGVVNLIGHLPIPNGVTDVWGHFDESTGKEYALLGGARGGVIIVDVTDPSRPALVSDTRNFGNFSVPGFDVKSWGHYVYSVTGGGGPGQGAILDISDPAAPTLAGNFDSSHNIFITEDGFMILEVPGWRVFDLNPDPASPALLASGGSQGHDASVIDGIFYDFHGSAGTFIYDFSNPADPTLISSIIDPGISYSHSGWTSKDGNYLYICDELANHPSPDIIVYDISELSNPQRVGEVADPDATVHNLFVVDDFMVTSYYSAGFRVFDVSNPAQPVVLDEFDTSPFSGQGFNGAWGVYPFAPSGNIYISDRNNGLYIFRLRSDPTSIDDRLVEIPEGFVLHANYPNPFNPETTITYDVPHTVQVELVIFNTLGQKVKTLVDTEQPRGSYNVVWDGRDDTGVSVPSGIYFYRLQGEDFITTRQMLLLK